MNNSYPAILAIETSTQACSVALRINGEIVYAEEAGQNVHSQVVLSQVQSLLNKAGKPLSALDAIAVGNGPGSFTGLRIGVGVGQGLAFGSKAPMIAICSLAALALSSPIDAEVIAASDARMGEMYWARYRKQGSELIELSAPAVCAPQDFARDMPGDTSGHLNRQLVGNAWQTYWAHLPELVRTHFVCPEPVLPSAAMVLTLAESEFIQGNVIDAKRFEPLYVRNNVAKKKAEQGAN